MELNLSGAGVLARLPAPAGIAYRAIGLCRLCRQGGHGGPPHSEPQLLKCVAPEENLLTLYPDGTAVRRMIRLEAGIDG